MSGGTLSQIWLVYSGPLGSSAYSGFTSHFEMQDGCCTDLLRPIDIRSASAVAGCAALQNRKQ
jgi:hypothetical protein